MSRFFAIALVAGLAACGANGKVGVEVSIKRAPKKETKTQVVTASPSLGISNELIDQCMVRITDAGVNTRFDYDDFDLEKADRLVLDAVGKCIMKDGPLAGRGIHLIGRADPRGTQEYNLALGSKRAMAVVEYLVRMGVSRDQIDSTTRGDIDARGRNEVGWREDRRVDVQLMEDLKVSSR